MDWLYKLKFSIEQNQKELRQESLDSSRSLLEADFKLSTGSTRGLNFFYFLSASRFSTEVVAVKLDTWYFSVHDK